MSQHEVAEELGMTRRQVDSIEKMAIRKIKSYLKNKRINIKDLI
jgi:transcriptional regulator